MSVAFFQNGSYLGTDSGWGGWTGNNNYVIRYDFSTSSSGASSVTIDLNNVWSRKGSGGQGWGFKISTSSTAYCNARNETPDSNIAYMSYDGNIGYNCSLTATGLNLQPNTTYYLFVYVATSGTEYYGGTWNCTAPSIYTAGSYTPPDSTLSSISAEVSTGQNVSIVMNNPSGLSHTATFKYGSSTLATSSSFSSSLSYTCPRSWMEKNTGSDRINISVEIRNSLGNTIRANFMLIADSGMKPVLKAGAAYAEPINPASADRGTGFLTGLSRAKVTFDISKIDMSSTAGATIIHKEIRWSGKVDNQEPYETGILTDTDRIIISVTDSRGRKAESAIQISLTPYVPPSVNNFSAQRCDSSGRPTAQGQYYKVIGTTVFTPLDWKNSISIYASIKQPGGDYGAETDLVGWQNGVWSDEWAFAAILGGNLYSDSYTVRLRIEDRVGGTSEVTARLYRQDWVMKTNSTGTAIGFGMNPTGSNDIELPEGWNIKIGGVDIAQAIANQIMGKLYQVGDYFITENNTDPNIRFGGKWVRVEGRYLKGAYASESGGTTGGASSHTHSTRGYAIDTTQIPDHQHDGFYIISDENHMGYQNNYVGSGNIMAGTLRGSAAGGDLRIYTGGVRNSETGKEHSHGDTYSADNDPLYRLVYIWRKTA